jgi:Kelch motif
MATKALPSGPVVAHRRALFGAVDADGWTWAGLKAFFWFIVIIMLLGYIPDRAYYFTVNRTIDLGIMVWSPVNLCPAENGGLPCPAPVGALQPWQTSPSQLDLPEGRTNGSATALGSNLLYVGGSNGTAPTTTTFVAKVANGNFSSWAPGPDLPEARQGTGIAVLNGSAYLVGGSGPDGKPTNTVWVLKSDPTSGALGTWGTLPDASAAKNSGAVITLPEARSGAAVLPVSDGIVVAGGTGPDGKPSTSVWKASVSNGNLGQFQPQPNLPDGVTGASMVLDGTFLWVYGGTDANGPSGAVQRASYGQPAAAAAGASPAASGAVVNPAPGASPAPVPDQVLQWGTSNAVNVVPRANAAGFVANGAIYLVGGSDGTSARPEVYWAVPDASGNLPGGWSHLPVMDLPGGVQGGQAVTAGSGVFIIGGQASGGIVKGALRASTAPQEPFFQLGIAGAVVPALQIPGEIGQQLGYLSAAGAGTLDFIILALIGWAYAHRPTISGWRQRRRSRRSA